MTTLKDVFPTQQSFDLFAADYHAGVSRYPDAPGFKDRDTSQKAARAIEGDAKILRASVLRAYRDVWPAGLTADEAAAAVGRGILSIRPRVTELLRAGEIHETTVRRRNESGRAAKVYASKRPE